MTENDRPVVRECYAKLERTSTRTGKTYKTWCFMGYYPAPDAEPYKSTKEFDFYHRPDGDYKYRKPFDPASI